MRKVFLTAAVVVLASAPVAQGASADNREAAINAALRRARIASAVVLDAADGRVLGARNARAKLPPASLLKMATALLVALRLEQSQEIVISERAALAPHDQVRWRQGARHTVDQLMHGMLMMSSNGAAIALAEATSGSLVRFRADVAQLMRALGAKDTRLIDPSGLDAAGQYSTASDLALMARSLLEYPWLAGIVATRNYMLPWPDAGRAAFGNLNRYLAQDPSAVGLKHGFTSLAGNCVAAASTRDGRTIIVIALNGPDVYVDARTIMDAAFGSKPSPRAQPTHLSEAAIADDEQEREVTETTTPVEAAGLTQAAQGRGGSGLRKLLLFGVVAAYVVRVRQVRVRRRARLRRRMQAARVTVSGEWHSPVEDPFGMHEVGERPPNQPARRATARS